MLSMKKTIFIAGYLLRNGFIFRIGKLIVTALIGFVAIQQQALAAPVTYKLNIYGSVADGSIGGTPFSKALVYLTFNGDTNDVEPFSTSSIIPPFNAPSSGYVLQKGTASFTIIDTSGTTYTGDFSPSAGIYVLVDNTDGYAYFGSHAVPPSDPTFPGPTISYPEVLLANGGNTSPLGTYDLQSTLPGVQGWAVSCDDWTTSCNPVGPVLPTTLGDLVLNHMGISYSIFTADVASTVPFASLNAHAMTIGSKHCSTLTIAGQFTLGTGGTAFNPVSDSFSLQIGTYSVAIPAGSFNTTATGNFTYSSTVAGQNVSVKLKPSSTGYSFSVDAQGVDVATIVNPATLQLVVGNNTGSATVNVKRKSDD